MVDLVGEIFGNLKNVQESGISINTSKTFDCLDHDLINSRKVKLVGCLQKARLWLTGYLKHRSQIFELTRTVKGGTCFIRSSALYYKRRAVKSITGPVIFILFTNNFPSPSSSMEMFHVR
ncbi:hypothetical protein J6590_061747 [Homalodisca vitripennis]|nr:hypothetical protein J6590_061747 [Homalodisca vitripennis]